MQNIVKCSNCGKSFNLNEEGGIVEGDYLCDSCLEELSTICESCGNRMYITDNAGDDDHYICMTCYDRFYQTCDNCGRVIRNDQSYYLDSDDESPLCYECYESRNRSNVIKNYYYKPQPIFYKTKEDEKEERVKYFGVELEIDEGGEIEDNALEIEKLVNANNELIYLKHDGSLDDGFEIVTHPLTLNYHQKNMPWQQVVEKARKLGYYSHQSGSCGLHVHVNRTAFGDSEEKQDECIARILYFFEKHWEELLKFSRRNQLQLERWARRYGYKEQPIDILNHAKKGYHGGRYSCVNLQNQATIEFRMFRGTLKYNTLIATLEIVNKICDVAILMSDEEIKNLSWTDFVLKCESKELIQYLKERRLYVNEKMNEVEEEV